MNNQIILNALNRIDGAAALVSAIRKAEDVEDLDKACLLIERELHSASDEIRKELRSSSEKNPE